MPNAPTPKLAAGLASVAPRRHHLRGDQNVPRRPPVGRNGPLSTRYWDSSSRGRSAPVH